jgi:hypothetical protein
MSLRIRRGGWKVKVRMSQVRFILRAALEMGMDDGLESWLCDGNPHYISISSGCKSMRIRRVTRRARASLPEHATVRR